MALRDFSSNNSDNHDDTNAGAMPVIQLAAPTGNDSSDDVSDMLINYNERFAASSAACFRDSVIQQTISCIIGHSKPNALLVGAAGTGKTKIVEDIARRLACDDPSIPSCLAGATIYELPLTNLVAGAGIVGELESKVRAVIDFMEDEDNDAIVFIDEIHLLMSDSQIYGKIAQMLKPAMARGKMRVIGATTNQEASELVSDPAFSRRFTRVIVDELTREQTVQIMEAAWPSLFRHYGNDILASHDTFEMVARLADRFAHAGNHRPDNALTLLDRSCADAVVTQTQLEANTSDPQIAAALAASHPIPITETQVRRTAMAMATGHSRKERLDVTSLRERLSAVRGQDETVDSVVDALRRDDLAVFPRERPLTFMFAGPSGVGKTEIAKAVAEEMCASKPIIINMTEYNSPASINRIIGSPAGYVGSDSHAELPFDSLETNPYQVILLDEIEKGDTSVQRLFMSAFDEGYIKTSSGKTVDFSKAIVFATTNASHTTGKASAPMGFTADVGERKSTSQVADDLSAWFDTEFLNRFSHIMTLNAIDRDTYREILAAKYVCERERVCANDMSFSPKLPDTLDDDTLDQMVSDTYVEAFGARPALRCVRSWIEETLLAPTTSTASN